MKFGLLFTLQDPPHGENIPQLYDEVFEQAEFAEQMGFAAFFVPEHHQMPDGYLPAPLTFAAALAARTKTAEIGTGIMQLPLYHPLHVAEQVTVIDNLSKGRFILGAGLGLVQKEFDAFEIPLTEAASRFTEAIEILKQAWTGKPFSHSGRYFRLDEVTELLFYFRHGILTHHSDFCSEADFTVANCFRHTVAGSPQECIDQLALYDSEYDVDYVIMRFRLPAGPERERVLDCLRLFGEEVLPQFHIRSG
jgi:alkanesulfonate monooxygenase SsuD/methylene tetrahydromethanopterin reductase-like flavin-dependent oxidoreductase (luciferase family)